MKRKNLFSLLLALILLFTLTTTAFAVDITIQDTGATSSYAAYKLLDATNALDENGEATDKFAYTLNTKYAAILKGIVAEKTSTLETPVTPEQVTEKMVIEYIADLDDNGIRTFADEVYALLAEVNPDYTTNTDKFENVDQGYFLIVETNVNEESGKDVISLVMLDTAGEEDITVETKESVPSVEKKVKDTDDSTGEISDWQDSADYDIGDSIPYQIKGTVSSEYANYKAYTYIFTDTMKKLTYQGDAKVFAVNNGVRTEITSVFTITWDAEKKILTLSCDDLKRAEAVNAASEIIVEYTAKLDADAVIGSAGNPNTVYLTYSRDPYHEGEGAPTNETPEDTNIVFTFEGIVNKVDKDKNELEGAKFTLYKYVEAAEGEEQWLPIEIESVEGATTFAFTGLDAGRYKLVETEVPAGYNKADDIEFVIVAEHDITADNPKLTSLVVKDMQGNVISGQNLTFSANVQEGKISTDVVNLTGPELPSTGGIGTTIFYILGGILVVGAGVLLITRKRMEHVEKYE